MYLVRPGNDILLHGHQLLAVEARQNRAVRQQELDEVCLGTEPHQHLCSKAVAHLCSVTVSVLIALRALFD